MEFKYVGNEYGKYSTKPKTSLTKQEMHKYIEASERTEGIIAEVLDKLPDKGEQNHLYIIPHGDTYKEYMWLPEENGFYEIGDIPIEMEEEQDGEE
jgi:hypothetical protein